MNITSMIDENVSLTSARIHFLRIHLISLTTKISVCTREYILKKMVCLCFRYLLQIVMEANCLEIASLISVILKDALALIRIVNAVRSPPEDKTSVSRIFQSLKALEAWAQSEW